MVKYSFDGHIHGKRILVVTNDTVGPLYLDKVTEALTRGNPNVSVESVILPDGEKYKNMVGVFGFRLIILLLSYGACCNKSNCITFVSYRKPS